MRVTYIQHSCFLVETDRCYYLFDYEEGSLPAMDTEKPILVLSSHGHDDHYNEEIFPRLAAAGMGQVKAILSDDIDAPQGVDTLLVSPGKEYMLADRQKLTTFLSTDLGVAFLIEDGEEIIYHSGDLNDWVWEEETEEYNEAMTEKYRLQIRLLAQTLQGRQIDAAFAVLDPRQEKDYDRGLCYLLETVAAKAVYPMHYWDDPTVIGRFLKDHPEYGSQVQRTQ